MFMKKLIERLLCLLFWAAYFGALFVSGVACIWCVERDLFLPLMPAFLVFIVLFAMGVEQLGWGSF